MTRNTREIFAAIDQMEPTAFTAHLTDDVRFRFGNADAVYGHEAVEAGISGFFGTIGGMHHHIRAVWDVDADTTVAVIDVEYIRGDGEHVFTPNVDILTWEGDKVADWQIVIDVSPIYAPLDQVPAAARALQSA
ncbi:nuclear transport factor 2 family protein [Microbacterium sp. RD1]|uniref:nuclear transport factor 2 family protein n=1 Tax=Microbacterium sp. RD1 TaxID=3457313 RepID=UPI003FA6111A